MDWCTALPPLSLFLQPVRLPPGLSCLQGLSLERYTATFVEQEIDLTVVHTLSAEDLASVGVTDRLHQVG